jgi:hypothetical protein
MIAVWVASGSGRAAGILNWPMSVRRFGQSGAYKSLRISRAARTASVDLWAREGPVEAILAQAIHRGIATSR